MELPVLVSFSFPVSPAANPADISDVQRVAVESSCKTNKMSSKENAYRRISGFGKLLAECQTQVSFFLLRMNQGKSLALHPVG